MDALNIQSVNHLFETDNAGNIVFNAYRFKTKNHHASDTLNIIEPSKLKLINKNILCKEEKQIRKPINDLMNEIIKLIDMLDDNFSVKKLAYIFNMSALIMTYRGRYQDASQLCKAQISCIKMITKCYGYSQPCINYYQPLINMARLDLICGKTTNSLHKFKKLFKVYSYYTANKLHPNLQKAFLQDNAMINIIASASLQGLFRCLIKLNGFKDVLQFDCKQHVSSIVTNLIEECRILAHLCLQDSNAAITSIENSKKEFNPGNINTVFFREAQFHFLTSNTHKSLNLLESLAKDSKKQYEATKNAYHLFFISHIAEQVKNIGDNYLYIHLIDYLIEKYQQINDEVGLISCLMALKQANVITSMQLSFLLSLLKNTSYASLSPLKNQMGIVAHNQQILSLENRLLQKLYSLLNRSDKYVS